MVGSLSDKFSLLRRTMVFA